MPQTTNQLLDQLFNDPKTGFVGADKLLRRATEQNPQISMKHVKDFLSKSSKPSVSKAKKVKKYSKDLWQNWSLSG